MGDQAISEIEYYARARKAPRIGEAAARLATQARDGGWTHEQYLAAVLSREVSARESSGAELRIRAAGFPARKSLEEFTLDHNPGLKRDQIAHLGTGVFLTEAKNVVLLGPPGTAKTHLAIGLGIKAAHAGHRVLFATATEWVTLLQLAHRQDRLALELAKLRRYGLIVIDEVGYIPFEQDAANLVFQLLSSRYEHASLILTSNLPFAAGRRLRRPSRRRSDDRPHRSPRRRDHLERRQLSAQEQRNHQHHLDRTTGHGRIAEQRKWPIFQRAQPAYISTRVDTRTISLPVIGVDRTGVRH